MEAAFTASDNLPEEEGVILQERRNGQQRIYEVGILDDSIDQNNSVRIILLG